MSKPRGSRRDRNRGAVAPRSGNTPVETEVLTGEPVKEHRPKAIQRMHVELQSFAGPLPHPEILERYEQVFQGSSERIFTQFEEQGRHRRKIESRVVWQNTASAFAGQVMGFVLFAGTIGGGIFLLYSDKSLAGLGSIVASVMAASWVLREAQKNRRIEIEGKKSIQKKRK